VQRALCSLVSKADEIFGDSRRKSVATTISGARLISPIFGARLLLACYRPKDEKRSGFQPLNFEYDFVGQFVDGYPPAVRLLQVQSIQNRVADIDWERVFGQLSDPAMRRRVPLLNLSNAPDSPLFSKENVCSHVVMERRWQGLNISAIRS